MVKYKTKSYSQQARDLADNFLMWENLEDARECLKNSYRKDIIKYRAIKRFSKKIKKVVDK